MVGGESRANEGIEPYLWVTELDDGESDFQERSSTEKTIPRPSHQNCVGVICLFSRRIDVPLADGFDGRTINWIEKDIVNFSHDYFPPMSCSISLQTS